MQGAIRKMKEISEYLTAAPVQGDMTIRILFKAGPLVRTWIMDAVIGQSVKKQGTVHQAIEAGWRR